MITKRFKLHRCCGESESWQEEPTFEEYIISTGRRLIATDRRIIVVIPKGETPVPLGFIHKDLWKVFTKGGNGEKNKPLDLLEVVPKHHVSVPGLATLLKNAIKLLHGKRKLFSVKIDMKLLNRLCEGLGQKEGIVEMFFSQDGIEGDLYKKEVAIKIQGEDYPPKDLQPNGFFKGFGMIMPRD